LRKKLNDRKTEVGIGKRIAFQGRHGKFTAPEISSMIASVVRDECDLEFSRACIKRGDGIDLVPILRLDLEGTVGFPGKPFAIGICDSEKKVQIIGGDAVFLQIAKAKVCVNLHCMTLLKGKPRIADLDLPGKVVAVGAAEPLVNGDFRRQRGLRMGERH
jgi:hypothetical protein